MCYTTAAPATLAKNGASLFFRVEYLYVVCLLNTFFRQIKSFLRFRLAFVFGLQTYYLIDFSKIYRLKGLEPKLKAK